MSMDALYLFKHSPFGDAEIRFSLRSIARHAPWVRKVWVYGDRPAFLADNTMIIEHVPHERTSRVLGVATPVTNFFLLNFLASLIPGLSEEYLRFSDDYYLIEDCSPDVARRVRYHDDMRRAKGPGKGKWQASLWNTRNLLIGLGFPAYNFETHTPVYLQRRWAMAAYCDFKAHVAEAKFQGMLGLTAILNHACQTEGFPLTQMRTESLRGGFWGQPPTAEAEGIAFGQLTDDQKPMLKALVEAYAADMTPEVAAAWLDDRGILPRLPGQPSR